MVPGLPTCGIGAFSNHAAAEQALDHLKHADFDLNHVSVVVRDEHPDDEMLTSEQELIRDQTIRGSVKGGLTVGALGSVAGILAGLATLALPGIGSVAIAGAKVALAGMFAGGYYGAAAGSILGAILGKGVSQEQIKVYSNHLTQGHYLIIVDATNDEIQRAESILSPQGIQDWGVYQTT